MKTLKVLPLWVALAGCGYMGTARPWDPGDPSPEFTVLADLKPIPRSGPQSCGSTALTIVDRFYRPSPENPQDPELSGLVPTLVLRNLARARGYRAHIVRGGFKDIVDQTRRGRPMIVGVVKRYGTGDKPHYEVVAGINETRRQIATVDPARGWTVNSYEGFLKEWEPSGRALLVLAPSPDEQPESIAAIGDEEDGDLAVRATMNEELQHFAGGNTGLEVVGHLVGGMMMTLLMATAAGNAVALPLGIAHSAQGQGFIPGESWHAGGEEGFLTRLGCVFGFPVYCVGYLIGLPFGPSEPRPTSTLHPKARVELARLGIVADALLEHERLALTSPGEIVVVAVTGPALEAGLQVGDVLTELGGKIVTAGNLADIVSAAMREEGVWVTILREETERVMRIKVPVDPRRSR